MSQNQTTSQDLVSLLFEPSPTLTSLLASVSDPLIPPSQTPLPSAPLPTILAWIEYVRTLLLALAEAVDIEPEASKQLDAILGSHPRLGAKKVESEISRREQAAAGMSTVVGQEGTEEERKLRVLNEEYERKFPGLRYVVFVNARPRTEIMENMTARIARGDINAERVDAANAMCDIAKDRATKMKAGST